MGSWSAMDIATLGGTKLLGGMGDMFGGGGDGGMDDMLALIARNTKAAEQDYSPYLTGGKSAQEQMMAQLGLGGPATAFDVTQLPGYQNALKQGLAGVNQGGAGAGMLMSGDRMQGLQSTGQNIFGDYYNNYLNRLTGMSNQGFSAAGNLANIRTGGMTQQLGLMQQQQAQQGDMMGDLLGLGGTVLGGMFGGPPGALVGSQVGKIAGGGGKGMMLPQFGGAGGTQNSALGLMGFGF